MAQHQFSRTELLIGPEGLDKLKNSKVAIFGIGGVGSYAVEALARAGVGELMLVDYDDVCLTNINRQLQALTTTVGKSKVELMKERALLINPKIKVTTIREFYSPENRDIFFIEKYDYIADAIDNVTGKIDLIKSSLDKGVPIVSCMGAGNKFDPTAFEVTDISKTSVCPLARVVRRELRAAGIKKGVKVIYSKEQPVTPIKLDTSCKTECVCTNKEAASYCANRNQIPGSMSFVTPVAGFIMASVIVRDLLKI